MWKDNQPRKTSTWSEHNSLDQKHIFKKHQIHVYSIMFRFMRANGRHVVRNFKEENKNHKLSRNRFISSQTDFLHKIQHNQIPH